MRALAFPLRLTLCGLALLGALLSPAHAAGVLRVLAWPGYVDSETVRAFERAQGVKVVLTVIDSDEALWQRMQLRGDQAIDVLALNTAELQRYVAANQVQPVEPGRIANLARVQPQFRELAGIPGLVHSTPRGERPFAIPYAYTAMGLIYDRAQFSEAPTSVAALWDARWRGKVLVYDGGTHNFSLAAQSLDMVSPFQIPEQDTQRVATRLIELRRNILSVYGKPEESVRLFVRHKAALMFANYGMQQLHLLREAGINVGYVLPREGALAWLDCWAISRQASNVELAHAWINHMLGESASQNLSQRQGLSNTVDAPAIPLPREKVLWLRPVEDAAQRERLWTRIRSGDRLAKVMAP